MIKSRRMRWAGQYKGEKRNAYTFLVGKPKGKRPLRRPRHRWQDVKLDLGEVWLEDVERIHVAQDMDQQQFLVNTVLNLWVHKRQKNALA
jgi:hypothetical protein